MEKRLSYGVMLSLREISLRRVTVILWSQTDMLALIDRSLPQYKIRDNMSKLELPPLLTEQLKCLVQPIGLEIRNWKWFHAKYLNIRIRNFDVHILEQLCWTILGTIDYRRTAENLIFLEILDIVKRYRLACIYCLENYIPVLWEKFPEWGKECFYKEVPFDSAFTQPQLEFCWPYILKGEETKLDYLLRNTHDDPLIIRQLAIPITFNQYAFKFSAWTGNREATEYFFQKLSLDEIEVFLLKTAERVVADQGKAYFDLDNFSRQRHSDTFRYLLSLMSPEQQMEILKRYPFETLRYVLLWPWQHAFWDVAPLIWPFLTKADYVRLLTEIAQHSASKICPAKLFREFFLRGSHDFRKYFVDKELQECQKRLYFRASLDWMDSETFKSIFRAVDSVDRMRLASSRHVFKFFYESLSNGKYHFVEQCLQEAAICKEDKKELKEAYFGFLAKIDTNNMNRREQMWKHFLHFLE